MRRHVPHDAHDARRVRDDDVARERGVARERHDDAGRDDPAPGAQRVHGAFAVTLMLAFVYVSAVNDDASGVQSRYRVTLNLMVLCCSLRPFRT